MTVILEGLEGNHAFIGSYIYIKSLYINIGKAINVDKYSES